MATVSINYEPATVSVPACMLFLRNSFRTVEPGFADETAGAFELGLADYTFNGRKVWPQVEREPVIQ